MHLALQERGVLTLLRVYLDDISVFGDTETLCINWLIEVVCSDFMLHPFLKNSSHLFPSVRIHISLPDIPALSSTLPSLQLRSPPTKKTHNPLQEQT